MLLLHLPHAHRWDYLGAEMDSFLIEVNGKRKGAAY
jgi:hypothetical protein